MDPGRWLTMTGTSDKPVVITLPDHDKMDGCLELHIVIIEMKAFVEFIKVGKWRA